MKHCIMILSPIFSLLICLNFSSQNSSSIASSEKPAINFYGTLSDMSGKVVQVENITIGGMFKQIPLYAKPRHNQADPLDNVSRIDLSEISIITVLPGLKELQFGGRKYIEINVTANDSAKTVRNYIIESTKKVRCTEFNCPDKSCTAVIEKDLSFKAIIKIVIVGHKSVNQDIKK